MAKSCMPSQECIRGSVTFGPVKTVLMTECCSSDLCNENNAPASKAKPNGKECFSCDVPGDCSGTLNCEGDEDHCFKASVTVENNATIKGCISRSVCGNEIFPSSVAISCCEGNYCNGADGAGVSLLLLSDVLCRRNLFFSN
uniref:Neuromast-expressed gpi-anchored lymphocyte antigen 6 n=1 Tax=Neogobius melanostomus TaxID=47308 RepID=A0A8C6SKC0_9GOBI